MIHSHFIQDYVRFIFIFHSIDDALTVLKYLKDIESRKVYARKNIATTLRKGFVLYGVGLNMISEINRWAHNVVRN